MSSLRLSRNHGRLARRACFFVVAGRAAFALAVSLLLLIPVSPPLAGGPRAVQGTGVPLRWNTTSPVAYNLDQGPLGNLENPVADLLVSGAFSIWGGTPVSNIGFVAGSDLPYDVNASGTPSTNPAHWTHFWRKAGDGLNPVIYDADGGIVDSMFGAGARFDILGAAVLDNDPNDPSTTITGGSIVINGAFFDGVGLPASPADSASQTAFKAIAVHEIGHFINLDHSVVNHGLAGDGDPDNDIYIPTMYPLEVDDEEAIVSLNPDDIAALGSLYPNTTYETTTAHISGSVLDRGVPFQGANIVVRRQPGGPPDDPLMYAYSGISGGRYFPCNPGGTCPGPDPPPPQAGEYGVQGIAPGDYTICMEQIDTRLSYANGTFIGPLATPATILGPEECLNGAESGDPSVDDPDVAANFTFAAGSAYGGLSIQVDTLPDPNSFTDPFEPNNTPATAATLPGLGSGVDTAPAILAPGDMDFYKIPAEPGTTISIDIDAAEFGSALDPVIGVYDPNGALLTVIDDTLDPDSGSYTLDPAYTFVVPFAGEYKVEITAYPDLDLNGSGQASSGPYWIRVQMGPDEDGDGVLDRFDRCPNDPQDDLDRDGLCANMDDCPTVANPGQDDRDADGVGDDCDNCPGNYNPGQGDEDGDGMGNACDACPFDPTNDPDGDGICNNADNCPQFSNPQQNRFPPTMLNPPLVTGGNVTGITMSADVKRAVYLADQDTDEVFELYSVPAPGGAATKLNPPLVANGDVASFRVAPTSARVVYAADQETDGVDEIYSVPTAGGAATKLNATLPPDYVRIGTYLISGDGARVVYTAVDSGGLERGLYSVPIAGGTATRLDPNLPVGSTVGSWTIVNSSTVVYTAGPSTGSKELYSVPIAGGIPTRLNGALVSGGTVSSFRCTADAAVYIADQDTDEVYELYKVPLAGGTSVKINPPLATGGDVAAFLLSGGLPTRVVYVADQSEDSVYEIYSVPLSGGTVTKLNPTLVAGGDVGGASGSSFLISGDGTRVVYLADQNTDTVDELFSVPIGGGTAVKLNGPLVTNGDVLNFGRGTSNTRVVYLADEDADTVNELYSVPVAGGAVTKLNGPLVTNGDVGSWAVSFDDAMVVYTADQDADGRIELYSVPISGGTVVKLNDPLAPLGTGSVGGYTIATDNVRVLYMANQDTGKVNLYETAFVRDPDGDGIQSYCDKCPSVPNPGQEDTDADGIGDACDNCPFVYNPGQEDTETAAGADAMCGTADDNSVLYGPDGTCGTPDDLVGDGIGDACPAWNDVTSTSMKAAAEYSVGAAWGDYDIDGDLDLYFANSATANRLFRNDGGGAFADVSAPPVNDAGVGAGVSWGDYDNDGDLDLYLTNRSGPNKLFRNDGGGVFTDVTSGPLGDTGNTYDAPWVDYDLDGDLDLFLVNNGSACRLLRNDGNGVFTDVTAPPLNVVAAGVTAAWGDYDNDGDQDLYLVLGNQANKLFRNDGGAFVDVSASPINDTGSGVSASWGDYDNDGDLDLFLTNLSGSNRLFRNDGGGAFTDVTPSAMAMSNMSYGSGWADYDNDGDLDLYVANLNGPGRLFRNDGGGTFVEATTGPMQNTVGKGAGVAWGDIDNDGDLDLFVTNYPGANRLIVNETNNGNHWLEIDLVGTLSNRSAIGARIGVHTPGDGQWRIREISGGTGFASQSALTVHFGLGSNTVVDSMIIRWHTGVEQAITGSAAADQRITIQQEPHDLTPPYVAYALPANGSVDAALSTSITIVMSEAVDEASVTPESVKLVRNNHKVSGTLKLSTDGKIITFDPTGSLLPDSDYSIRINEASAHESLKDLAGNIATPFSATFDTAASFASSHFSAGSVGTTISGSVIPGTNANDQSGYSNALVGDVNGDGLSDILLGAPNADDGSKIDAGKATLVFGSPNLLSASTPADGVKYMGESAADHAGYEVAWAGDINEDGRDDFLIGAPNASPHGASSGKIYLLFGDPNQSSTPLGTYSLSDLAGCASPKFCGVVFEGEAAGDQAGYALAYAGDVNGDGHDDILIGAPSASPDALSGAGKVYLVYGPIGTPGVIQLSSIGSTKPGIVFHGEGASHGAGAALSRWEEYGAGKVDDFLIGAPGASVIDPNGNPVANVGYVYAIWGGMSNLDAKAVSGVIDLSRVASGATDEVKGFVFIGVDTNGQMGRSVTGTVDLDGDGVPDIAIGGAQKGWVLSGDGPKGTSGTTKLDTKPGPSGTSLTRTISGTDVESLFGGILITTGADGDPGGLTMGGAGDVNNDGFDDLIVGAGGVDANGNIDSGRAYILYGSPSLPSGEILLSDIGKTVSGVIVDGFEAGDGLGQSVDGGMDVNGDGVADALVGAPYADSSPTTPANAGESYLVSPLSPLEVATLWLTPSGPGSFLEWTVASRALRYNLYRGSLGTLRIRKMVLTSDMVKLACGINTDADVDGLPDATDPAAPSIGQGFFYLVTGANDGGEGPIGPAGAAPPRDNDAQCP